MPFPDNCIKGIPNDSYMTESGPGSHLFDFRPNPGREDNLEESSINWEDTDDVVDFTLQQRKENEEFQFKWGVAVIPVREIDRMKNQPTIQGMLSYERRSLDDGSNPYHGNILISQGLSKPTIRKLQAGLALAISRLIPREIDSVETVQNSGSG